MSSASRQLVPNAAISSYRLGALLFAFGRGGELLFLRRSKKPNKGLWCAAGGKLDMSIGESPYECAIREAREEIGIELVASDLDLRCILSEKNYEDSGHWLMFVFVIRKVVEDLPEAIDEGEFAFFDVEALADVAMPELDAKILRERILNIEGPLLSSLSVDGALFPLIESERIEEELF